MGATIGRDLIAKGVSVVFGTTLAVRPTDLEARAGEILVVLGPSGCGKTALLRTLSGLHPAALGRIPVGGVDVTDLDAGRRGTAMVFSEPTLFPTLTARDDVAFGLRARGVARAERRRRAAAALDLVGLPDAALRWPDQLDDVERRLVALARAIAVEPAVLFLDEPFTVADPAVRRGLHDRLVTAGRELGATIVLAIADSAAALAVADRIAVMRAGRVDQIDTPDRLLAHPATAFVAGAFGETNRFGGRVIEVAAGRVRLTTPLGPLLATPRGRLLTGDPVELIVRPEHVAAARDCRDDLGPWNRFEAELVGRTLEGACILHDFTLPGTTTRFRLRRPNRGLTDGLLAGLHALAVRVDDTHAFPLGAGPEPRGPDDA